MDSKKVRQTFFDFFKSKQHKIVPSAPMVIKDDPTLMFTNAGMNQFKNYFLGNTEPSALRIADTQKCLRVSGKHNDLDEVGHDTYHHTMFEMLGNWSFGNYFKKEAIEWAWELLTDVYKIKKENLYITVFGGDEADGMPADNEAYDFWKSIVPENQIVYGSKKDNFWEMGDTGPCGPCSEIHIDIRDEDEKKKIAGRDMVNTDHPEVIEIWNLVFIEFNRKSDSSLEALPSKHVDTGMGFERLCLVLQNKKSNYDTDIFQSIIGKISEISGFKYGKELNKDIAMRVIADHLRAVAFAIADGQLPSNNKAGYVIRRILRRAVRYGYTFLNLQEPFINDLVPVLIEQMGGIFPELSSQQELIKKVIFEEETAFLRTLSLGIKRFEQFAASNPDKKIISGDFAFELFDTFGFPIDLTEVMAREKEMSVDMAGFNKRLEEQKNRSRKASVKDTQDWIILKDKNDHADFVGYEFLSSDSKIVRYRKVTEKKKKFYQVVLDKTPFYAESGGQVGDKGFLIIGDKKIKVTNTLKENDLTLHITSELPEDPAAKIIAEVDSTMRMLTANNHSATHLMHSALREVLGSHVEQKGSLVDEDHLRFDFSHFSKLTDEEIAKIENIVNEKIRENIPLSEKRNVPMKDAIEMGAVALFGEKYGDDVRVITFDPKYSVELCGGTHVSATGQIGFFKITSESAIAAGIRRIEAISAIRAEHFINDQLSTINELKQILKGQKNLIVGVTDLMEHNNQLQKQINGFVKEKAELEKKELLNSVEQIGDINFVSRKVDLDANAIRDLAFKLQKEIDNLFLVLGSDQGGKAGLTLMISESLVNDKKLNAGQIIREIAKEIQGGGGGQAHFATAGGKNPQGIEKAFQKAKEMVSSL